MAEQDIDTVARTPAALYEPRIPAQETGLGIYFVVLPYIAVVVAWTPPQPAIRTPATSTMRPWALMAPPGGVRLPR